MFNKNGEWTHDHLISVEPSSHLEDEPNKYRIVHGEGDFSKGLISHTSPLGKAALQLQGKTGTIKVPAVGGSKFKFTHEIKIVSHRLVSPDYKGKKQTHTYHDPLQEGRFLDKMRAFSDEGDQALTDWSINYHHKKWKDALNKQQKALNNGQVLMAGVHQDRAKKFEKKLTQMGYRFNDIYGPKSYTGGTVLREANKVKRYAVFTHGDDLNHQHVDSFHEPREAHDKARQYSHWHNARTFVVDLLKGSHAAVGQYDSGMNMKINHHINEEELMTKVNEGNSAKVFAQAYHRDEIAKENKKMFPNKNKIAHHTQQLRNITLDEGFFTPSKKIDLTHTAGWSAEKHEHEAGYLRGLARAWRKSGKRHSGAWADRHDTEADEHERISLTKPPMKTVRESALLGAAAIAAGGAALAYGAYKAGKGVAKLVNRLDGTTQAMKDSKNAISKSSFRSNVKEEGLHIPAWLRRINERDDTDSNFIVGKSGYIDSQGRKIAKKPPLNLNKFKM